MKKIFAGIFITAVSSGFLFFQAQPDGLLHVYVLDVGQGDSILIRTPGGENILMDGGPGDAVLSQLKEVLPFFDRSIDYIVLSHPHRDHYEGFIAVLKNYPVRHAFITGSGDNGYLYQSFLNLLRAKNVEVTIADQTSDVHFSDGVTMDVLFPFHQLLGSHIDVNNTSIVAKILYGKNSMLFTGDAEAPEEEELLKEETKGDIDLAAEVLKVGHHGSSTSTTEEFLTAVHPSIGAISVGKENKYHHPSPSVVDRLKEHGVETYRTDEKGRIEFIFSQEKITEVKTER